jgi:hypothetical protein
MKEKLSRFHPSSLIPHPFFTLLFTAQVKDQQAVAVIAQERRAFDGAGKAQRLLKTAVCDFQLMIDNALFKESVTTATRDFQRPALNSYLKLFGAHAREINFDNPPVGSSIDIRIWTPHARARPRAPPDVHHPKITFDRFSHKSSDK